MKWEVKMIEFFVKAEEFKKKYFFQMRSNFYLLKLKMHCKTLFSIVQFIKLGKKVVYKINT